MEFFALDVLRDYVIRPLQVNARCIALQLQTCSRGFHVGDAVKFF